MSKDLFSTQAHNYARYRPEYPVELISYIVQFVNFKSVAWDCATGNGQVAIRLADAFESVYATDISEKQLSFAREHPRIAYSCQPAETTSFPDNFFDLITVAQAYHWFDFSAFQQEATRVAKPGAIIAIWGYNLVTTADNKLDSLIAGFYKSIVGPYWDNERKWVEENYSSIPFSFESLPAPAFSIRLHWTLNDMLGYLHSWSSVQNFASQKGYNPIVHIQGDLETNWGSDELKEISFPLFMKLGRVNK